HYPKPPGSTNPSKINNQSTKHNPSQFDLTTTGSRLTPAERGNPVEVHAVLAWWADREES
ncbi:hypothetical protein ACWDKQ_35590, partial [Saccharopolyspora sp. NPDC000995]